MIWSTSQYKTITIDLSAGTVDLFGTNVLDFYQTYPGVFSQFNSSDNLLLRVQPSEAASPAYFFKCRPDHVRI